MGMKYKQYTKFSARIGHIFITESLDTLRVQMKGATRSTIFWEMASGWVRVFYPPYS